MTGAPPGTGPGPSPKVDPPSTGAPARTRRRRLLLGVQLAVACIAVAVLLHLVGVAPVLRLLASADPAWLAAAVVLIAAGFVMNGLSLLVLYRGSRRGHIGVRRFFEVFFASAFIATWLPGRVGDLSIAYLARREIPASDSVTYVLADKLVTLAVLGVATLFALDRFLDVGAWYWPSAGAAVLVGGPLALWLCRRVARAPVGWIPEGLRVRLAPVWQTVVHLLAERRGALAANVGITVVRLVIVGASLACLLATFGSRIPIGDATLATGAIQLLAVLPISIQGIGVTEGAYIVLLREVGVPGAAVLATGLVGRVVSVALLGAFHVAFTGFAWTRAGENSGEGG